MTLTAADKDAIKKMLTDKAIEGDVDPKAVDMSVPDKCVPATALARAPLTRASTVHALVDIRVAHLFH